MQNLSALFKAFHELGDNLDTLQSDYKKASESSEEATADYEAKNRAFLDEQAGIIAETLENGKPCPVCGSLEHPCIAHKSAKAPTEAQLKRAKENADKARKGAEDLSGKCKEAKGILDAKKAETEKLAKELWQSVTFEDVENDLPEEQKVVSAEIAALDTALSEEEKKVSRRSALSESLPKTEMSLAERDKDITARSTALEADRASLSEKKNQRNAAKESLRFDNIAEAQRKSEALGKTVSEMKEAYDNAQSALSDSDKKIAGYNASITELSKQLSSDCDLDKEAETKKKAELSEKRTADDDAAKALHTHIESNTKVLANIQAKVGDLDALEKRYTWLKALSNTANGNISGKEKVMLETYIQMTYFDRIIARANTRFMVMSGGQYELKRRKEAENNRSQSGLDLDVIDHYNGTERSVKTLSGGESFKASFSLALGLSDEIQASAGGVKLDTMFVDEGFGSLDEESIDQAMKALLSLVDGNRLVGIISHVQRLIHDTALNLWVKRGVEIADNASICPFCGNPITDEFWSELHAHFDEESRKLENDIGGLIEQIRKEINKGAINDASIKLQLYSEYIGKYEVAKKLLDEKLSEYYNALQELIDQLEKRLANISHPVEY